VAGKKCARRHPGGLLRQCRADAVAHLSVFNKDWLIVSVLPRGRRGEDESVPSVPSVPVGGAQQAHHPEVRGLRFDPACLNRKYCPHQWISWTQHPHMGSPRAKPLNPVQYPSSALTVLNQSGLNAHPPAMAYSLLRWRVSTASMPRIVALPGTRIAGDLRLLKRRHGSTAVTVITHTHRRDRLHGACGGG
jgi:hypothetical protein